MEGKKTLFSEKFEKEVGFISVEQDVECLSITLVGAGKNEGTNTTFKFHLASNFISIKARPKEIADLIFELQGRCGVPNTEFLESTLSRHMREALNRMDTGEQTINQIRRSAGIDPIESAGANDHLTKV